MTRKAANDTAEKAEREATEKAQEDAAARHTQGVVDDAGAEKTEQVTSEGRQIAQNIATETTQEAAKAKGDAARKTARGNTEPYPGMDPIDPREHQLLSNMIHSTAAQDEGAELRSWIKHAKENPAALRVAWEELQYGEDGWEDPRIELILAVMRPKERLEYALSTMPPPQCTATNRIMPVAIPCGCNCAREFCCAQCTGIN